jgi:hypothetical protein
MPLTAAFLLKVSSVLTSPLDLSTPDDPLSKDYSQNLSDGNGANQAQQQWHDQRTIAPSGNDDLDLAGVLTNAFGALVTFTKIKALIIRGAAANANDVVVGGAAANQLLTLFGSATDKVKVKPGGILILLAPDANGYGVTAGTGDILRIANGGAGTSVTYDIIVIGV